jgi:hypothetical protein
MNLIILISDDAKEVVAYHTDTRLLGTDANVGHTDHYVNGGQLQPECMKESILKEDICSHRFGIHSFVNTVPPFYLI